MAMLKNALLIYNAKSGHDRSIKLKNRIASELKGTFSTIDFYKMSSIEKTEEDLSFLFDKYYAFIVCGGDGTLNQIINIVCKSEIRPVIGYVPTGTMNDAGKNLGICSIKKALKIIKEANVKNIDIANSTFGYFLYMAAVGVYSDISYTVKRKGKRKFGVLSYYFLAIKEAFQKSVVKGKVNIDGTELSFKSPFLLLLGGRRVGGFLINRKASMIDGKIDLYITRPGLFNGLLNYFIFKKRLLHYSGNKISIELVEKKHWCLDGEKVDNGNLFVEVKHQYLSFFLADKTNF